MRKAILLCAVGLVAVAGSVALAYKTLGKAADRPLASTRPTSDQLANLQLEVNELRRESTRLRQLTLHAAQSAQTQGGRDLDEQAMVTREGVPTTDPSLQNERASDEVYLAHVADEFGKEAVHPTWNPTNALRDKVSRALPKGSSIRTLECRSTMCRMETSHGDALAYQAFTRSFMLGGGAPPIWTGPAFLTVIREIERDGDELVAVAYLGREALPHLEQ